MEKRGRRTRLSRYLFGNSADLMFIETPGVLPSSGRDGDGTTCTVDQSLGCHLDG